MNSRRAIGGAVVLLAMASLACSSAVPATPTATAAPTRTPVPPTETPKPTATARPTATPDVAATERADHFAAVLRSFQERGYVTSATGQAVELEPFEDEWAQLDWYSWSIFDEVKSDFLFSARFKWSTASKTPSDSGCGIVFGIQPNDDHYAVFLDQARILFLMKRGRYSYEVGKTSGSGVVDFGNPAEADFAVAVIGQKAYVSVDGQFTVYTLSKDQSSQGDFGYSILSGTNKDYGTRCEITDQTLWFPTGVQESGWVGDNG